MDSVADLYYIFSRTVPTQERPGMGVKHSSFPATAQGERVNSSGRPRATRTIAGSSVDLDGVPTRYTRKKGIELPEEFYQMFRDDPDGAIAMWTTDEA